jgi:uncharacterized protein (TIGR02569 family)
MTAGGSTFLPSASGSIGRRPYWCGRSSSTAELIRGRSAIVSPGGKPNRRPRIRSSRLLHIRRPVNLSSQVIHGDLTENVLFADSLEPAVIDVTPYWRPAGFAAAVVVADAVCWHEADLDTLLPATSAIAEFPQLLVRAAIYRLATALVFGESELDAYARVIRLAERLVARGVA